mmetsp:Transcript_15370/g.22825  ORF Transcript_15370/g.22825 Transcript_15370/m.22825 type:complete len:202 (+) Transcript_15370:10-615(+)
MHIQRLYTLQRQTFKMMKIAIFLLSIIFTTKAFIVPLKAPSKAILKMAADDLAKVSRAARKAGPNDRVIKLTKPLGLVLQEDNKGDVFIAKINSTGSAIRNKKVFEGDKISFVSATFGDELWSVRGAGVSRVQRAIKVRQGNEVSLVLESTKESAAKLKKINDEEANKRKFQEDAQKKKDRLLVDLDEDTKKKSKKFFGLF